MGFVLMPKKIFQSFDVLPLVVVKSYIIEYIILIRGPIFNLIIS